jgi:hypothetical protein
MKNEDVLLSHKFEILFGDIPSSHIQDYCLSNIADEVILTFNFFETESEPINPVELFNVTEFKLNYLNFKNEVVVSYNGEVKGFNFERKGTRKDNELLTTEIRVVIGGMKKIKI